MKWTGQYRDQESCLEYFVNRYVSPAMGRFTSPDRPFADQWVGDPQSWNMYAYVRNNPLRYVDPTGTEKRLSFDDRVSIQISDNDYYTYWLAFGSDLRLPVFGPDDIGKTLPIYCLRSRCGYVTDYPDPTGGGLGGGGNNNTGGGPDDQGGGGWRK